MKMMKKLIAPLLIAILVILVNSCEIEKPVRYFELNGVRHDLSVGFMDNWGTNASGIINTRYFAISLRSSENYPEDYITFFLGSLSAKDLVSGDYYYNFPAGNGEFENVRIGSSLQYDRDGFTIGGIRFADDKVDYDGVVRISGTSNGNYNFFININITVKEAYLNDFPESSYELVCEFDDDLIIDAGVVDPDWY